MTKNEVKKLLIDMNKTQSGMARDLGLPRQYIWAIFCGHMKGYKYRRRISQYLGVAEEILFPDKEDQ